jgi:hypothetical protein
VICIKPNSIDEAHVQAQYIDGDKKNGQSNGPKQREQQEHKKSGKKKGKEKSKKMVIVAHESKALDNHCKHCNVDGHTKDCWKFHLELRPKWSKQQHKKKKRLLSVETELCF